VTDLLKQYICEGKSRKEIAKLLNRSKIAIDKRITKLFIEYGVSNRAELVRELILEDKQ